MRAAAIGLAIGATVSGCVEIDPAFYEDVTGSSDAGSSAAEPTSTGSDDADGTSTGPMGPPAAFCDMVDDAVVFCTDFEEGNLDHWDDYDLNDSVENVLTPDPGPRGAENNTVMRLRIPPGPDIVDLVKLLPGFYDRLHMRWYIQYESGYDMTRPGLQTGLHAGDRDLLGVSDSLPTGDDRFAVLTSHTADDPQLVARLDYRGMYQQCDEPVGGCFRDQLPCLEDADICTDPDHTTPSTTPPLQTGQWYCVELMVDAGTPVDAAEDADGIVELRVDDEVVGRWDDLWLRTDANLKLNVAWLLLYYGGDHGDEGVLYDDVVVSREPVGCWPL